VKKALVVVVLVLALVVMSCTTVNLPAQISDGTVGTRTGQASGTIILGLFGTADAGMITAARNGGITRIGAVDVQVTRVFGALMVTYTTTVTGE